MPSAGVLLPGAADPRPELAQAISAAGARPLALPLYATHPTTTISTPTDFSRAHLDAILYASPTAAASPCCYMSTLGCHIYLCFVAGL